MEKLGEGTIGTVYKLHTIAFKCVKNSYLQNELVALEQEAFEYLG